MTRRWLVSLAVAFALSACADSAARDYNRGMERWNEGQFSDAIGLLRVITRNHPTSKYAPRALLKVAQIQAYDLRMFDEAEDTFQLYLKLYPQSNQAPQALEELSTLLFEKKHDYMRAVNECQRYIDSFPTSPKIPMMHQRIIYSYEQLREFDQARVEAGLFLRKFPDNAKADEVAYGAVRSYFVEGKLDKAMTEARRLIAERPNSNYLARTRFIYAASLEELDRLPEALVAYGEAREGHPEPAIVDEKMAAVIDRMARKHK